MFKALILSSVLVAGICPFSKTNPLLKAPADPSDVKSLIASYVSAQEGKYTKKTHIHFNNEAVEELKDYFHCKENAQQRQTYYDETTDALLMGNVGGTFTSINSGYIKNGSNMDHYRYTDAEHPDVDTLFTAKKVTYTVPDTTPNQFFINLTKVANEAENHNWTVEDGVYTYEGFDIEVEDGHYKDAMLHDVVYFAVPMLLESVSEYLSPTKITVSEVSSKLVISLYLSTGDNDKLDNTDGLLSTATIEKGLILS